MWENRLGGAGHWFWEWEWLVAELLAFRSHGGCKIKFYSRNSFGAGGINYFRVQFLAVVQTVTSSFSSLAAVGAFHQASLSMILECSSLVPCLFVQLLNNSMRQYSLKIFLAQTCPSEFCYLQLIKSWAVQHVRPQNLFLRSEYDLCEHTNWCVLEVSRTLTLGLWGFYCAFMRPVQLASHQ